jgi:hypothetical protein
MSIFIDLYFTFPANKHIRNNGSSDFNLVWVEFIEGPKVSLRGLWRLLRRLLGIVV